ncbi:DUF2920 family protein [Rummeliibacillus pycnus]|uniref:DUF2920 family protein n=1 Tax=Rummeliibacillus pycnus TaxID=101070 RepID=UPI003D2A5173
MAEQYSINIPAHQNIYTGTSNRELRIDFSTPQNGVNEETGLVVFVPGFGGNIDSKVYKKMREVMADKYNLITIQCEYFGSKYMQSAESFNVQDTKFIESLLSENELRMIKEKPSNLLNILSSKDIELHVLANINEDLEEFNDMSYMQAIDIITAIESVKIIMADNDLKFNENRIIGYGHSHGAYLLHLCNILDPYLFSFIIDNSAWTQPVYLSHNRILGQKVNKLTLVVKFDYIAKKILKDASRLNLKSLYQSYNNMAQILAFQGENDKMWII